MNRSPRLPLLAVLSLASAAACAQTQFANQQFEVASIRPAAEAIQGNPRIAQALRDLARNNRQPGDIPLTGTDRIRLHNWALLDLIAAAYGVLASQVSGPSWLVDQIYDVDATLPEGTHKDDLHPMLQALLEDRFGLQVHRAAITGNGFALVVDKGGPRLKPAEVQPALQTDLSEDEQKQQTIQRLRQSMKAQEKRTQEAYSRGEPAPVSFRGEAWGSITMADLAPHLISFVGAPVIDQTGLTGTYSVHIGTSANSDGTAVTIFDSLKNLGLKLEPRKFTVETIVVEQVLKTPTPN